MILQLWFKLIVCPWSLTLVFCLIICMSWKMTNADGWLVGWGNMLSLNILHASSMSSMDIGNKFFECWLLNAIFINPSKRHKNILTLNALELHLIYFWKFGKLSFAYACMLNVPQNLWRSSRPSIRELFYVMNKNLPSRGLEGTFFGDSQADYRGRRMASLANIIV